jgi:hypothetical protein
VHDVLELRVAGHRLLLDGLLRAGSSAIGEAKDD